MTKAQVQERLNQVENWIANGRGGFALVQLRKSYENQLRYGFLPKRKRRAS